MPSSWGVVACRRGRRRRHADFDIDRETFVKYVVLIYGNPESRAAWEGMSAEQRAAGLAHYQQLSDDLDASGERIVSERLAFPELTTQVSVGEHGTTTTDGPFAEAKEFLAGFYLLDCESRERAIAVVEVRPVMGLR
jgi:hypothetical protein